MSEIEKKLSKLELINDSPSLFDDLERDELSDDENNNERLEYTSHNQTNLFTNNPEPLKYIVKKFSYFIFPIF